LFFPEKIQATYEKVVGEKVPEGLRQTLAELRSKDKFKNLRKELGVVEGTEMTVEQRKEYRKKSAELMKEQREKLGEYLTPYFEVVYANFYINSYALDNLISGDRAIYKSGKETEDLIKRLSIAAAPGNQMRIGKDYMKEETNVLVLQDKEAYVRDEYVLASPKEEQDNKYEITDAQGYVLPEYKHRVRLGLGRNAAPDVSLKPVFFGYDKDGIQRAIKFSAIELTDELVQQFPGLAKLRNEMRSSGNDMAIFQSALKVGQLKEEYLAKLERVDKKVKPGEDTYSYYSMHIPVGSSFTIPSAQMRIQLDPAKAVIGKVANPSQLAYLGMSNPAIFKSVKGLWKATTRVMRMGSHDVDEQLRLLNGKPTVHTMKRLKKIVMEMLETLESSEREFLLASIEDISWDIPMLTTKAIRTIGSFISKETSNFKMRGGKLILQSEVFTDINIEGKHEPLKWRDKDGFTEVYVSDLLLKQLGLTVGQAVDPSVLGMVGYRIPSTGLHSAIVMKIKGTYPVPAGSKGNIVIAPHRIVHVHGSDYDVDTLQFITRYRAIDVLTEKEYDIAKILKVLAPDSDFSKISAYEPYQQINYKPLGETDTKLKKDNKLSADRLEIIYNKGINLLKSLEKDPKAKNQRAEIRSALRTVRKLIKASAKNDMVDTYMKMIQHPSSRKWIELPITMSMLKDNKLMQDLSESALDVVAQMRGWAMKNVGSDKTYYGDRNKYLYPQLDPSDILDQQQIHFNTFSGNALTGAGANAVKILAYIMASVKPKTNSKGKVVERPAAKLKENYQITFNGAVYDSLSHKEKKVEKGKLVDNEVVVGKEKLKNGQFKLIKKTYYTWETMDSLINAAIDNVKEQILFNINLNKHTSNPFFAALGLGIPLNDVTRLMVQPALLELSKSKSSISERNINFKITEVKELLRELHVKDEELDVIDETTGVTNKMLEQSSQKYASHGEKLNKLGKEELFEQLKTLYTFRRLHKLGLSLFESSQSSVILRQIPTEYSLTKKLIETLYTEMSNAGLNTEDFLEMQIEKNQQYDEILNRSLNTFTAAEGWPFENSALLDIPHFKEAFTNALKFLAIAEDSFFIHSAPVNSMILNIVQNKYRMKIFGKESAYSKGIQMKNDFLSFINSTLDFSSYLNGNSPVYEIENEEGEALEIENNFSFSLAVDTESTTEERERVTGFDAFSIDLAKDLNTLKDKFGDDNIFLKSLEVKNHWQTGIPQIRFYGHNTATPSILNSFKQSFLNLNSKEIRDFELENDGKNYRREFKYSKNSEPIFSDIQLRLFKYLLISRGFTYGASTYMEILPKEMYQMYSVALTERINEIQSSQETPLYNSALDKIEDLFAVQFALNRGNLLDRINSNDVILFDSRTTEGEIDRVSHGEAEIPEIGTVYFDLMLKGDKPMFVNSANDFARGVYYKITTYEDVEGKIKSLYRRLGSSKSLGGYTSKDPFNGKRYDINRLIDPKIRIANDVGLDKSGRFSDSKKAPKMNAGQYVYLRSNKDVGMESVRKYQIESYLGMSKERHVYMLKYISDIDPFVEEEYDTSSEQSTPHAYTSNQVLPKEDALTIEETTRFVNEQKTKVADNVGLAKSRWNLTDEEVDSLLQGNTIRKTLSEVIDILGITDPKILQDLNKVLDKYPNLTIELTGPIFYTNKDGILSVADGMATASNQSLLNVFSEEDPQLLLHHEVIHNATMASINNFEAGILEESSEEYQIVKELNELYEEAKRLPGVRDREDIYNLHEFVSVLKSDPSLAYELNKAETPGLFARILNYLRKLIASILNRPYNPTSRLIFDRSVGLVDQLMVISTSRSVANEILPAEISTSLNANEVFNAHKQALNSLPLNFAPLKQKAKKKKKKKIDIIDFFIKKAVEENITLHDNKKEDGSVDSFYSTNTVDRLARLTESEFIQTFIKFQGKYDSYAEAMAAAEFRKAGVKVEDPIIFSGDPTAYSFQDRVNYHNKRAKEFQAYGNMAHLMMERYLSRNSTRIAEIDKKIAELAEPELENGVVIREGISPKQFNWLEDRMKEILAKSEIAHDTESSAWNDEFGDIIAPELRVAFEKLGLATTIDGLLQHVDGSLSIVDWKTGRLLSDQGKGYYMNYGKSYGIKNDKLSRAKLEVTVRALIIKYHQPEAQFNNLSINWLHKRSGVRVFHINLENYLSMISDMLEKENPEIYAEFKEKGLFDASNYFAPAVQRTNTAKYDFPEGATQEQQIEHIKQLLEGVRLQLSDGDVIGSKALKKRERELVEDLLKLELPENYKGIIADEDDMDRMKKNLYNLKDPKHKIAQVFSKSLLSAQEKARKVKRKIYEEHDELLKDVLAEYYRKEGKPLLAKQISQGNTSLFRNLMGTTNARKLFAFM
jgi:hypothetical protein